MRDWTVIGEQVTPFYYYIAVALIAACFLWRGNARYFVYLVIGVVVVDIANKFQDAIYPIIICMFFSLTCGADMYYRKDKSFWGTAVKFFVLFAIIWEFKMFMVWDFRHAVPNFFINLW